ncbi:hypothetical protein [Streptomyces sp. NPDC006510]|uniref:hypothetical protein n=1 Tax=Streptomyces sp. NPDC006510 TaxID=3155600 RepID=UPI0033A356D9
MDEWKYTLLNGVISTVGALVVGALAFVAASRAASKGIDAAVTAAVTSNEGQQDLTLWKGRRDTYAALLSAVAAFIALIKTPEGSIRARTVEELEGPLRAALADVEQHANLARLEGPRDEIEIPVRSVVAFARDAGDHYLAWVHVLHDLPAWPPANRELLLVTQQRLVATQRQLVDALYAVLHPQAH